MKSVQLLVAALLLVASPMVLAEKPDPVNNPPLQVREANTDPNNDGAIRVHEVGTADVNVTGGSIDANVTGGSIDANISGGSVEVSNTNANPVPVEGTVTVDSFPDQQDVWVDGGRLSPVTNAYYDFYLMDSDTNTGRVNFTNGPILATSILISDTNDRTCVQFYSETLAPAGENVIMKMCDYDFDFPVITASFPHPIELDGFRIYCNNQDVNARCGVSITVVGF